MSARAGDWPSRDADAMTDNELIQRALDGETIGGARQVELLVAALRKWRGIARLREHALREIHKQIDQISMCEFESDDQRNRLLARQEFERDVAFNNSFSLEKMTAKERAASGPIDL